MRLIKLPYYLPHFNPNAVESVEEILMCHESSGEGSFGVYVIELTTVSGKVYKSPRFPENDSKIAMENIKEVLKIDSNEVLK